MDKAIKILEQEVDWHQKNPNKAKGMSFDWINGFNKGCEHCLSTLIRCKDATPTLDASDSKGRCECV